MIPVNQENLARSAAPAADSASTSTTAPESERHEETAEDKQDTAAAAAAEVKGDPEMAPVFLRHLLPVFTQVFQSAMVQSVRFVSYTDVALICKSHVITVTICSFLRDLE